MSGTPNNRPWNWGFFLLNYFMFNYILYSSQRSTYNKLRLIWRNFARPIWTVLLRKKAQIKSTDLQELKFHAPARAAAHHLLNVNKMQQLSFQHQLIQRSIQMLSIKASAHKTTWKKPLRNATTNINVLLLGPIIKYVNYCIRLKLNIKIKVNIFT